VTRSTLAISLLVSLAGNLLAADSKPLDPRNLKAGLQIPSEPGYCDQPYIAITKDGNWLCVMTTGYKVEGQPGQHVVSTISKDQGRTWSTLVDIEPADGPQASWVVPLVTPGGRVYVFYDYNGDHVSQLGEKKNIRADMLGWYVYKYSDDYGRSWSKERFRLPVQLTAADLANDWKGKVQIFWGIDKPKAFDGAVMFGFTKLGKYLLSNGEGWFFRSENILTEPDASKIRWDNLPLGDHGVRLPEYGSVQEEHNIVPLGGGSWYCIYRTTMGFPCESYSRDDGRSWSAPQPVKYTDGRALKHPRACPKMWRTSEGKYLLWHHNNGTKKFDGRNPAWLSAGVLKDGKLAWSEPEIVLYDDTIKTRTSYPDLVEQDGKFWISETQKDVARVHPIDGKLLEGLWNQQTSRQRVADDSVDKLPRLGESGGFTLQFNVRPESLAADVPLVDTRNDQGRGIFVSTGPSASVQILLNDGKASASWISDANVLQPNRVLNVGIVVDAGPRIITFITDGRVNDGGAEREFGWGRFPVELNDVSGGTTFKAADVVVRDPSFYARPLRNSELIGNYRASLEGAK